MSVQQPAVNGNGNGSLRRWMDKLLVALVIALVGLTGIVYGIQSSRIEKVESAAQKIQALEARQEETYRRLDRIEAKLDKLLERAK